MEKWHRAVVIAGVAAGLFAVVIFKAVSSPVRGGIYAGSVFVLFGVLAAIWGRRAGQRRSFTYVLVLANLFLFSLPIFVSRMINLNLSFGEVRVFGIPGPQIHRLSEIGFMLMLACAVIEGRIRRPR